MNTKTSYKLAHNFYDGNNHDAPGRDGPGALLDMLAEVASRTLRSESIRSDPSTKRIKQKVDAVRRVCPSLPRILSMPRTQLVKHFAVLTSDELKRRYTYECALVPGCQQKYTSFASESRARISITTHLVHHLDSLRNSKDSSARGDDTSEAEERVKKHRGRQGKKLQEIPNKENELAKSEKSTSYLRKILSDEINFKEFEGQEKPDEQNRPRERCPTEMKNECDVPVDHSYYERVKEGVPAPINEAISDNIMLMVVERDRVCIEELTPPPHDGIINEDTTARSDSLDYADAAAPAKPKGKAKFIGTSKEEREMALILMERIKKKGNPTGSNLQCRICDPPRSFTAPTTLVSHYRSHAGIKPYECRICRSVFTRRHSLKYHMLIHQNQTRFTCADCGKKFRHPSHFREHRRRHTGESPFGCDDCGQRFKTRNTYKRHLKTRHGKVLTTSGELLRLTEEEFQKVQTNRKRKKRSVSSDYPANEDSTVRLVHVFESENNNKTEETVIETDKTEMLENNGCFVNEYEESSDRILYDGIVMTGGEVEVEVEVEEFVNSPIEMLENLSNRVNSEYPDVEYDDQSLTAVVVDENNEFIVPHENSGSAEYYESGSIMDQEIVEHHLEEEIVEEQQYPTSTRYTYARIPQRSLNLDNFQDEKLVSNIHYSSHIDKSFSCRNNNGNNDNNNNETENNSIIAHENNDTTARQLEANDSFQVDEIQLAIDDTRSIVEESTFIVLRNNDFKANYLRIDGSDNIVLPQK